MLEYHFMTIKKNRGSRSDPSTKLSRTALRRKENQGESTEIKEERAQCPFFFLVRSCPLVLLSSCVPMVATHVKFFFPSFQDTDPFLFFLFSFLFPTFKQDKEVRSTTMGPWSQSALISLAVSFVLHLSLYC